MRQSSEFLAPGAVLGGKYEVEGIVGTGGMGVVYRVLHTEIGRHAAIKLLLPQYTENKKVLERFHREARAAGSIGHHNICEVTDMGKTRDGVPFLVMPLLTGKSFGELLSTESITLERLADMVGQTLSALQAAHDSQIVHRDLKPDNIFVTQIGKRTDFIKLLDFGVSKILDRDIVSDLTQTGQMLGTPYYMAPEQARGAHYIDHRVDLYAMGVILYEALAGVKPFLGTSWNEVMFNILSQPMTLPSVLNPDVPDSVERIVMTAMKIDATKRFASADEMRIALEKAIADVDATQLHTKLRQGRDQPMASRNSASLDFPTGLTDISTTGVSGISNVFGSQSDTDIDAVTRPQTPHSKRFEVPTFDEAVAPEPRSRRRYLFFIALFVGLAASMGLMVSRMFTEPAGVELGENKPQQIRQQPARPQPAKTAEPQPTEHKSADSAGVATSDTSERVTVDPVAYEAKLRAAKRAEKLNPKPEPSAKPVAPRRPPKKKKKKPSENDDTFWITDYENTKKQ